MNSLAKGLSNHLDRVYTVRLWHRWAKKQVRRRRINDVANKHVLLRHLRIWKMHTKRSLAILRAEVHWREAAKRNALVWLQKSAQDCIAMRGKNIVAEDHWVTFTLASSLRKWMDYIRGLQEYRGKMNQAEDYERTKTMRTAFNRIGQPIIEAKAKEMKAHGLRKEHKTRQLRVSVNLCCCFFIMT